MADNTSVNISLPETMRAWIDRRMETGGFGNTSEYFRHLIREDQEKQERRALERTAARARLDALLLEGLNSPISDVIDAESVRRITERAIADAKRAKSA
jgi:antitoxin ParD1/3/4